MSQQADATKFNLRACHQTFGAFEPSVSLMKTCLIISPYFPPSTLAGVHRARHLVKHLPAHGWRSKVLCIDPKFHTELLDPDLAELVPADAAIVTVGALSTRFTQAFGVVGDIGLRGFAHLWFAISRQIKMQRPDVVFITGSPYYPMLLARSIRRRWSLPVVLDFQDPWLSRDGADQRFGSKAWLAHRLAVMLEPIAAHSASFITSVSDQQNHEMTERYPWLDPARMAGIPIGGDPSDFDALRQTLKPQHGRSDSFVLSYVGTALPRSGPLFRSLFKGLKILRERQPELASRILVRCIGTSNQPNGANSYRVRSIAESEDVAALVMEYPARVPYLEALKILSTTDAVLIVGSDEPHYTASKIYPAMMSGKPFLSIFHHSSSAHAILSKAGGGIALSFDGSDQLEGLPTRIANAIMELISRPTALGSVDPTAYADLTAHAIAGRFAAIFEQLSEEREKSNHNGAA